MIYRVLIACLVLASGTAMADCQDRGILIDQRSQAQQRDDADKDRLRCVVFVLTATNHAEGYGWVAWHHDRNGQPTRTTRLGLFPVHSGPAMAFGRVPENLEPPGSALAVTVLLPSHRWWLVNTTRHGWQLRSGAVSDPDMETLRKLFTDVAINAGVAEQAQRFERWWPRG